MWTQQRRSHLVTVRLGNDSDRWVATDIVDVEATMSDSYASRESDGKACVDTRRTTRGSMKEISSNSHSERSEESLPRCKRPFAIAQGDIQNQVYTNGRASVVAKDSLNTYKSSQY